jgi:hypothetical protein
MYSWKIIEFSQLMGNYHSCVIKFKNGSTFGTSVTKSDGENLMKYFQVNNPIDLCGKTFKSETHDIHEAIELLIFSAKFDGKYVPPSNQLIYAKVARALANMKEPDFCDVDKFTIYRAFQKVYETDETKNNWFKWLKKRIRTISQGTVSLRNARSIVFNNTILGPANYMILVSKNRIQKLTIGPYSDPVSFES